MRQIKIQVLFVVHNKDFTKSVKEHYTTVERLMNGDDTFDYITGPEIIARRLSTGLTDKNGVDDVYEHDLFESEMLMGHPTKGSMHGGSYWVKCLFKIEFFNGCFVGVAIKQISDLDKEFSVLDEIIPIPKGVSAVGNIHQHPELLK